jgi:hypothetical protein
MSNADPVILKMEPQEDEASKARLLRMMTNLVHNRRERVVVGVVQLLMDFCVEEDLPVQHLPSKKALHRLAVQVRALMVANSF